MGTNYNSKEKKMMSKSHIRIMEVCQACKRKKQGLKATLKSHQIELYQNFNLKFQKIYFKIQMGELKYF